MGDFERSPFLSIIIPARDEEQRLPPSLHKIADFLRKQPFQSELIVVENGSSDRTSEAVTKFCEEGVRPDDPFRVHLLHSAPGKGAAVKLGMLHAKGDYRIMSDADLAVPIEEVTKFLPPVLPAHSFDIALASREGAGAIRYDEPWHRHLMGRVFNALVRILAVPGIQDTQCGFKCFTREATLLVFPLQRIDGWGFDVEILHIASLHGLRMVEVPVHWYYGQNSRIRPIQNTISMVTELVLIRRNGRQGFYNHTPPATVTDNLPAA